MKKPTIKIRRSHSVQDLWFQIRNDWPHLLISGCILLLTFLFWELRVRPLWHQYIDSKTEYQQLNVLLLDLEKEKREIAAQGPFQEKWLPVSYLRYAELCTSDTLVYKRLAEIVRASGTKVLSCKAQKDEEGGGFEITLSASGSYAQMGEFLRALERRFVFFQWRSVNITPKYAETNYEGRLTLNMRGKVW